MNSEQQYIDLFSQCRELIDSHSSAVMNSARDEAFAAFCAKGFPTRKVERYKYTDIAELMAPDYGLNLKRLEISADPYEAFRCDVPNLSTSLYFVVNDAFHTKALPKSLLPEGVIVGSLREVSESNPEIVEKYYARIAKSQDDGVTALNTMLAQDGLLVYVPKGVVVDRAIQIINILKSPFKTPEVSSLMVNRRVLIVVEACAEVKLLFCDQP